MAMPLRHSGRQGVSQKREKACEGVLSRGGFRAVEAPTRYRRVHRKISQGSGRAQKISHRPDVQEIRVYGRGVLCG